MLYETQGPASRSSQERYYEALRGPGEMRVGRYLVGVLIESILLSN